MNYLNNPKWLNSIIQNSKNSENQRILNINKRIKNLVTVSPPVVSIVIPVKNEESNIINCLDSISRNKTAIPCEIIVINNSSTDNTKLILDKLNVRVYDQPNPGIGWTRQLGLESARGEYILTADADCFYHPKWIETMYVNLKREGVVCVSGRYSFIGHSFNIRLKLRIYELLRNLIMMVRQKRHPYLNAWGGCMGYMKAQALEIGYDTRNIRGEDGRLCFDLMLKGKVRFIDSYSARVWTKFKYSHSSKGGVASGVLSNLNRELWRSFSYFKKPKLHNTKTSANSPDSLRNFMKSRKK